MGKQLTVAFIGNPNCGKTTLFNAYTGANLKVANWPGVTVERVEGVMQDHGLDIRLVDLPGTYSLTAYTMEEQVSRQFILSDEVDVIIDVVDASALERNLYLTLQLLELGKPVVVALNMMDVVQKRGMEIDLHRLPEMLGVPVIPVSARKRTGLEVLMHAAAHHARSGRHDPIIHEHEWHSKGRQADSASSARTSCQRRLLEYTTLPEALSTTPGMPNPAPAHCSGETPCSSRKARVFRPMSASTSAAPRSAPVGTEMEAVKLYSLSVSPILTAVPPTSTPTRNRPPPAGVGTLRFVFSISPPPRFSFAPWGAVWLITLFYRSFPVSSSARDTGIPPPFQALSNRGKNCLYNF